MCLVVHLKPIATTAITTATTVHTVVTGNASVVAASPSSPLPDRAVIQNSHCSARQYNLSRCASGEMVISIHFDKTPSLTCTAGQTSCSVVGEPPRAKFNQ